LVGCCASGAKLSRDEAGPSHEEIMLASRTLHDGLRQTELSVPDMHCGGCLQKIESVLGRLDRVANARANLSTRSVTVLWGGDTPPPLIATLRGIGYQAHLHQMAAVRKDPALSRLLRALAVAGFAASNIMML